jgi:hypothetical protein
VSEQQTQATDDPSGPGWRDVSSGEILHVDDMVQRDNGWGRTRAAGTPAGYGRYRRRIEQPQSKPEANPDDPSGEGWRDVEPDEILQDGDMFPNGGRWERTGNPGITAKEGRGGTYRRRIGPQQPSDSEPETMQDLRQRLNAALKSNSELEHVVERQHRLLREAKQVNAELQQLREQVTTLTRERDRYRNQLAGAIEHSSAAEAQAQLVDRLQAWLRPVLELVAEHPEDASPLAVAVLGYLPGIASRLIEE